MEINLIYGMTYFVGPILLGLLIQLVRIIVRNLLRNGELNVGDKIDLIIILILALFGGMVVVCGLVEGVKHYPIRLPFYIHVGAKR